MPNTTAEFTARELVKAKSEFHAFRNSETHLYCSPSQAECVDPYPLVDYFYDPIGGTGRLAYSEASKEIVLKLNAESNTNVFIYPNPNEGVFKVRTVSALPVTIEILNSMGVLLDTYLLNGEQEFDKSQFSSGLYFLVARVNGKVVKTNRLIIQK